MFDRIKEYLSKPLYAGIAGFVIGLLIGLPILGWWIWPVKWYDAAPSDMRSDIQQDYVCMMIDSYARNENASLAVRRFAELGESGPELLSDTSSKNCPSTPQEAIDVFQSMMKVPPTGESATGNNGDTGIKTTGKSSSSILLLSVLCLVTLLVGAAAFYLFVLKPRRAAGVSLFKKSKAGSDASAEAAIEHGEGEAPIAQFMTTYVIGDDLYDDSFSIDAPNGEFLGECGVGISETIGTGEPKKVTAFEVWLFDKNDIQTVTKMVMSRFAFNDATIRQRLMPKGELLQVQPGQRLVLETATLTLEAHVVDINYGQGGVQPESHFDRLTLELSLWQKA